MMLKRILFLTFIANVLFSVAYAMESEKEPRHLPSQCPKSKENKPESCYEEDQENLAINDLYWRLNGKSEESIDETKALFYKKCANQLVVYKGSSQKDDPNCGLPQEIAQPFLKLCRQLTQGVKNKIHQIWVIQAAASLNKAQVATLVERTGNTNNPYLTMWHCLVSETQPDENRYKIISLLPHIQESNIDELLRINVLLGDMNGEQLFELVKIFTTLPEKNHFCRVENCQRVFKKRPNRSVRGKLEFLQSLSNVSSKELETFLEAAEKDDIADEFYWIE